MTNIEGIVLALRKECEDCSEMSFNEQECHSLYYCPVRDAADLIESLAAERDATVRDITCENICEACEHNGNGEACRERKHFAKAVMRTDCFEWRGAEGKEEAHGVD